jgi:hypothetical protein
MHDEAARPVTPVSGARVPVPASPAAGPAACHCHGPVTVTARAWQCRTGNFMLASRVKFVTVTRCPGPGRSNGDRDHWQAARPGVSHGHESQVSVNHSG